MSSNNNDSSAIATGIGILGVGFIALAVFLFAIAAFVTFVLSILCLIACIHPLRLGKWVLTSEEASGFLLRGIAGMWLVPAFVYFCDIMFGLGVVWDYLGHLFVVGYVGGSLGWVLLTADSNAEQPQAEVLPPAHQITHQSNNPRPSPWQHEDEEPFKYASWDDDEELRR